MLLFRRCTIFLLLLLTIRGLAQGVYMLRPGTEIPLFSIGMGTAAGGYLINKGVKPLTPEQIAMHHREDILPLNRFATHWHSAKADRGSDVFFYAASLAPVLLLADPQIRKQTWPTSILYLETLSLAGGLTHLTKNLTKKSRPFVYHPDVPITFKQRKDARKSFFSGHTSVTAAACFFTARVWSDQHPGRQAWKPAVWTVAAGIPALTGFLRIRAGKHFLTDVLAGYAVGAAVGLLVPALHRRKGA